jgi:hypothetical protein
MEKDESSLELSFIFLSSGMVTTTTFLGGAGGVLLGEEMVLVLADV